MPDILIRNLTDVQIKALDELARQSGVSSRQEYVLTLITSHIGDFDPGLAIAWIESDRFGEVENLECIDCHQDLEFPPIFAVMGDMRLLGPYCHVCATTD